jgi:hypothetical protein
MFFKVVEKFSYNLQKKGQNFFKKKVKHEFFFLVYLLQIRTVLWIGVIFIWHLSPFVLS